MSRSDWITPQTIAAYLTSTQQPNAQYSALASLRGDICEVPTTILLGAESRLNSCQSGAAPSRPEPWDGTGIVYLYYKQN